MRSSRDLDRRTFLKLGLTGTAAAAINPSMGLASVRATRTLSSPPTLVDMASDRLTYRLRDLFNCPVAMNEWGYAQVAKSVSAITAISFRQFRFQRSIRGSALPGRCVQDHERWSTARERVMSSEPNRSHTHDFDAQFHVRRNRLVGGRSVGYQHMQFLRFADSPVGHQAQFAAIDHRDAATRKLHHRRIEFRLIGIETTCPPSRIHSIGTDEHPVDKH